MAIGNFLTTVDVADILKVSERRVLQFVKDARLKPVDNVGGSYVFAKGEVTKFASKPRRGGRPRKKS